MKEDELRKHATCSKCGNKIGHTGIPLFWTVSINRHGIKLEALRRSAGLYMMLGSPELARAMGTNEEMTEPAMDTVNITLCEECALPIMGLIESCKMEERSVIEDHK